MVFPGVPETILYQVCVVPAAGNAIENHFTADARQGTASRFDPPQRGLLCLKCGDSMKAANQLRHSPLKAHS